MTTTSRGQLTGNCIKKGERSGRGLLKVQVRKRYRKAVGQTYISSMQSLRDFSNNSQGHNRYKGMLSKANAPHFSTR
jgi:hypothetical protein